MDVDIDQIIESSEEEDKRAASEKRNRLNAMVAVTVALLATFAGLCHIKDDNLVQAMEQAQADRNDNYSWYQARNIRQSVAETAVHQLTAEMASAAPAARSVYQSEIAALQKTATEQADKKKTQEQAAKDASDTYNALNYRDDQFDLADAMLAIAVSLLAVTALTQKKWLYYAALVPTVIGVLFGLAGLLGWHLHSALVSRLLS